MTTIPAAAVRDLLEEVAAYLDLDSQSMFDTIDNEAHEQGWAFLPEHLSCTVAARLIAVAVADDLAASDWYALEDAKAQMVTDGGWEFDDHGVVLWMERNGTGSDTIVAWLGNVVDGDMTCVGRAVVA